MYRSLIRPMVICLIAAMVGAGALVGGAQAQPRATSELGTFTQWVTVSPASGWQFVSGNFVSGGLDDVVGYSPSNGSIWVGTNTGTKFTFAKFATLSPAAGWTIVAGDFIGNGLDDLVAYSPSNGSLWVGQNTGTKFTFTKFSTLDPKAGWTILAGDFVGDTMPDVAAYYAGNGTIWAGLNTGTAFTFSRFATLDPPSGWQLTADTFAGDPRSDIGAYYSGNGSIWVGVSNGAQFGFVRYGTMSPISGWTIASGGNYVGTAPADLVGYFPLNGGVFIGENVSGGSGTDPGFTFRKTATLDPASGWSLIPGNYLAGAASDLAVYYPGNGSIWVG